MQIHRDLSRLQQGHRLLHFGNAELDVSRAGGDAYLAFATGTIEPIMVESNSSLPLCMTDSIVDPRKTCATSTKDHVAANQDLNHAKVVFVYPHDQRHDPELNTWPALCINNDEEKCPIPRPSCRAAELFGGRFAKERCQS